MFNCKKNTRRSNPVYCRNELTCARDGLLLSELLPEYSRAYLPVPIARVGKALTSLQPFTNSRTHSRAHRTVNFF